MVKTNLDKRRRRRVAGEHEAARLGTQSLILVLSAVTVIAAALVWCYWPTLQQLYKDWQRSQEYSVGQLVPVAALWLLWNDRRRLRECRIRPCLWGIAVILLAQTVRAYGLWRLYESAERYSLVLTVAGLVLLVAGRRVFREVRWILIYLVLMVPLPGRVHNLISFPLQTQATIGAVFLLELFQVPMTRRGNIIEMSDGTELAVAEACSGLRMLTAFVVVAAVLAYFVNRPRWQKAVLVVSSVPIAIVCNTIRLAATAVLCTAVGNEIADVFFHDFAGWAMMPLALLILLGELFLMKKLIVPDDPTPS